jgi:hypothetical protein
LFTCHCLQCYCCSCCLPWCFTHSCEWNHVWRQGRNWTHAVLQDIRQFLLA